MLCFNTSVKGSISCVWCCPHLEFLKFDFSLNKLDHALIPHMFSPSLLSISLYRPHLSMAAEDHHYWCGLCCACCGPPRYHPLSNAIGGPTLVSFHVIFLNITLSSHKHTHLPLISCPATDGWGENCWKRYFYCSTWISSVSPKTLTISTGLAVCCDVLSLINGQYPVSMEQVMYRKV